MDFLLHFNLLLKCLQPALVVVKSQLRVKLVEHLGYFKVRRVVIWVELQHSLVQRKGLVPFSLKTLDLGQETKSLVAVFVSGMRKHQIEAFVYCVEVTVQEVEFSQTELSSVVLLVQLHRLEVVPQSILIAILCVVHLAQNEIQVT